jgi:hypothetical protein
MANATASSQEIKAQGKEPKGYPDTWGVTSHRMTPLASSTASWGWGSHLQVTETPQTSLPRAAAQRSNQLKWQL